MVYFLMPNGPVPRVFRKADLFAQDNNYDNIHYRVVTPPDSSNLQASYVYMLPHDPTERQIHKHGKGQEMILVLDGCVHVMVEEEKYKLEQGDSILFEADIEHLIYTEDQPATIVLISSPPVGKDI